MNGNFFIALFAFLIVNTALFAQETQPSSADYDKPGAQTQAAQTQPAGIVVAVEASQTQEAAQTQISRSKKTRREFALTISALTVSLLQPWSPVAKQNDRLWQTGFATGAGIRGATGFAAGQIIFAPQNPNSYFGTEISAGKTLRKIGGVGFGAGIRYWYARQKQEVLSNDFWRVYAADKWHAGFLTVDSTIGRFNGSNVRISALVGPIYASTVAEIFVNGKRVGVGQLKESFIPAYGGEIYGKWQISEKFSFTGSVLYIGAPPADFSGRQNTVIPRANVFLFSGADYTLPFKIFGKTARTGFQSAVYISKQEIPIVKRGVALRFSVYL